MTPSTPSRTSFLKKHRAALLMSVLALGVTGYAGQAAFLSATPAVAQSSEQVSFPSFRPVVEKVRPAVVSIQVKSRAGPMTSSFPGMEGIPDGHPLEKFFRRFEDRSDRGEGRRDRRHGRKHFSRGQGSGFFISEDGYVVTNNHVINDAESVKVVLDDGKSYDAEIIGSDDKTDLALLKVDADRKFDHVRWSKNDVYVGDWVVAVGNPFGLGGTVTAGIVSARGREIGSGPYDDYIQIDAPINKGNSGGPTFDLNGNVVGVNTAIFSPSGGSVGIGFAIPAATARDIVEDLKDDGSVVRGWLGVQIQGISADIADSLGISGEKGALVTEPQVGSPAERAGLKAGDAILAVDGKDIESPRDLARVIAGYSPRTEVKVTVWRDGRKTDIDVTLGRLPGSRQQASLNVDTGEGLDRKLGLALTSADRFGSDTGVAIAEVDPESAAAEKGLRSGDIILSIGGERVSDPRDVQKGVKKARSDGRKAILFQVQTRNGVRFVALPLENA